MFITHFSPFKRLVGSNKLSLKNQRFIPLVYKDIGIRKFEFVAKTQFLNCKKLILTAKMIFLFSAIIINKAGVYIHSAYLRRSFNLPNFKKLIFFNLGNTNRVLRSSSLGNYFKNIPSSSYILQVQLHSLPHLRNMCINFRIGPISFFV